MPLLRVQVNHTARYRRIAVFRNLPFFILCLLSAVNGQWQQEGDGTPICIHPATQKTCLMAADSSGGAYIVWQDERDGQVNIWAQHLNARGYVVWDDGGIPVTFSDWDKAEIVIMNDGLGGLLLVWRDQRYGLGGDLFGQRFLPGGATAWETNGKELLRAANTQSRPAIAPAEEGYFFLCWLDDRIHKDSCEIRVQKFNLDGKSQWPADFVIKPQHHILSAPCLAGDGRSGAFIAWVENKEPENNFNGSGVFLLRIDNGGKPVWTPDRLNLILFPAEPELSKVKELQLISGKNQDVWLYWVQNWVGDVAVLDHVSATGERLGPFSISNYEHVSHNMIACGADGHGWCLTSQDNGWSKVELCRQPSSLNSGKRFFSLLLADGSPIDDITPNLRAMALVGLADGSSVAIWLGYKKEYGYVCLAQNISADGEMQWQEGGLPVVQDSSGHLNRYLNYLDAVSDGGRGVLVAYVKNENIYAKKMLDDAVVSVETPSRPALGQPQLITLLAIYPNPFNDRSNAIFELTESCDVEIGIYDLQGRVVRQFVLGRHAAGRHSYNLDLSTLASGIYFCRLLAADRFMTSKLVLFK